jgi:hypothetical protein
MTEDRGQITEAREQHFLRKEANSTALPSRLCAFARNVTEAKEQMTEDR